MTMESGLADQGQLWQAQLPFLHVGSVPPANYTRLVHLTACRDPKEQEEEDEIFWYFGLELPHHPYYLG